MWQVTQLHSRKSFTELMSKLAQGSASADSVQHGTEEAKVRRLMVCSSTNTTFWKADGLTVYPPLPSRLAQLCDYVHRQALFMAAHNGFETIVALLAQSQALDCVDAATSDGATALIVATHHGYIEVQLQLESQCNG